ncbi:MAG: hypothetical protein IJC84_00200 [Clostridia bacterium]|nr:hypothetical protein [Clostridia bacterium]
MKKILYLSLALLLLLSATLLPTPVSAKEDSVPGANDTVTVYGDWEYAVRDGYTYRVFRDKSVFTTPNAPIDYFDVDFADSNVASLYRSVVINAYARDYNVLEAYVTDVNRKGETLYLVLEGSGSISFFTEGTAHSYSTEGRYSSVGAKPLSLEDVNKWKAGEAIHSKASAFEQLDTYCLYANDHTTLLQREVGLILQDGDDYYLLDYSEYDRSFFYADGSFALDSEEEITLYALEDKALAAELSRYYDLVPDDDLEIFDKEPLSDKAILIITVVVLILLPLAGVFVCIGFIFVKKPKRIYRILLWIMAGCGALIILAASVMLISVSL